MWTWGTLFPGAGKGDRSKLWLLHGWNKSPYGEPPGWESIPRGGLPKDVGVSASGLVCSRSSPAASKNVNFSPEFCNTSWTSCPRKCCEACEVLWSHILDYCWFPLCKSAPKSVFPALRLSAQKSQDYWQLSWLLQDFPVLVYAPRSQNPAPTCTLKEGINA